MSQHSEGYRGARFYKCDLQMQTPEDTRHWRDDALRLAAPRDPADMREKARLYLRRCHEVGLEVIGITDHNFSTQPQETEWFLFYLIEQNERVARDIGRPPLVIFPGFEIDIGYHLVCLFEPGTPLNRVSDCLTRLGLPPDKRRLSGQNQQCRRGDGSLIPLSEVLQLVQDEYGGLVIAAHAFSHDGIAYDKFGSTYAADFKNDQLLAVEVNQVPLDDRADYILKAPKGDPWYRERPAAYLLSSDAKKLSPSRDGDTNYIGWRHTWIKMSRPSIAALRQAFLDQAHQMRGGRPDEESRIRFGPESPDKNYDHAWIRRIRVRGAAFLSDQDITFSRNLNTLIGGRGTGKSTLIEYLRLALGRRDDVLGDEAERNVDKILKTVGRNTVIEVEFEKEGQSWVLRSEGGRGPSVVNGQREIDIRRLFPVRVFSQKEIYGVAEKRESRARLLDNLIEEKLAELRRQQEDLIREISSLGAELLHRAELKHRRRTLETERLDFQARVIRLQQLEQPLRRWKGMLAEEEFFKALGEESREVAERTRETIEGIDLACTTLESQLLEGPHGELIRELAERADALVRRLREVLKSAVDAFEKSMVDLLGWPEVQAWREEFRIARDEYDSLREELHAQGVDPDQYLTYQTMARAREVEIREVDKRLQALEQMERTRDQKLAFLKEIWNQETSLRCEAAERLTQSVPKLPNGQPFVRVRVEPYRDDRDFAEKMQDVIKDWRRISREDWGYFDEGEGRIVPEESFLSAVVRATPDGISPVDTFLHWVETLRAGHQPNGCPWDPGDRRTEWLLKWLDEKELFDLALYRPRDRILVELFRQDGSRAGDLEQGLSVGQRCTAILALLLAQDRAPVVIDQPEDDLDNEFIFSELVPLLRQVKERRQLIIATHNANIPVNADAELIIALEARDAKGVIKRVGQEEALGALDRDAVRVAVEEIMEGSEEAFRRRYEKYGF